MRERNWTREQINEMSLRDVRVYFMPEESVKGLASVSLPQTKTGQKFMQPAIENLMRGRVWHFKHAAVEGEHGA
jgi:hypothetical protein